MTKLAKILTRNESPIIRIVEGAINAAKGWLDLVGQVHGRMQVPQQPTQGQS